MIFILGLITGILLTNTLFLAEIWLKSDSGILKIFHNKTKDFLPQPKGFIVQPKTERQIAVEELDKMAGIEGTKYEELVK